MRWGIRRLWAVAMGLCFWAGAAQAMDEGFTDVRVAVGLTSPRLPSCTAELERLSLTVSALEVELSPDLQGEAAKLS